MIRRFALLQTFVAVARAGKMKQAAQDLAVTPGAVSPNSLLSYRLAATFHRRHMLPTTS